MAVKEKGEVAFEVPDSDDTKPTKVYTLKLGFTALAMIEQTTKRPATQLLSEIVGDNFKFTSIRLVLFAALQDGHAKEFQREDDVDDLIERADMENTRSALADCIAATWKRLAPKQWAATQEALKANPQTASRTN